MVRIISINVNGLENKIKRVNDFIKDEKEEVICLQDIHHIQEKYKDTRKQSKNDSTV